MKNCDCGSMMMDLEEDGKKISKCVKCGKQEDHKEETETEDLKKQKHYMVEIDGREINTIKIIEGLLTPEEFKGFLKGNALKYLFRADKKNQLEDYRKNRIYADWLADFVEKIEGKKKL